MKFLDSVRPQIIAATRIVVGFLFAQHGFVKFFGVFGEQAGRTRLDSHLGRSHRAGGWRVGVHRFADAAGCLYLQRHDGGGVFPLSPVLRALADSK